MIFVLLLTEMIFFGLEMGSDWLVWICCHGNEMTALLLIGQFKYVAVEKEKIA